MTTLKVPGVKSYRSKGRRYYYHRATSQRITVDPATDPIGFAKEVERLDGIANAMPKPEKPQDGTLGGLFDAWRNSEEWKVYKGETRESYERIVHPETGALQKALGLPVAVMTAPIVKRLRDKVKKKRGWWLGNYTVKTLRAAFAWGRLEGWGAGWNEENPAKGVPLLPRPDDMPERNRPWTLEEFEIVSAEASPQLRLALYLGLFAGLRIGDIITIPWTAWNGVRLVWRAKKRRAGARADKHVIDVLAVEPLRIELEQAKRVSTQIVANRKGHPYTRSGLRAMLTHLIGRLAKDGKVRKGLSFHGLRHGLGATLYDLELPRQDRKAALSHESDASSQVYERGADRSRAADRAFIALDNALKKRRAVNKVRT